MNNSPDSRDPRGRIGRVPSMHAAVSVAFAVSSCGSGPPSPPPGVEYLLTVVVENRGIDAPTAVVHDSRADLYLVANAPAERGDRARAGFVSLLTPGGEVRSRRWIEGGRHGVVLNDPSALAIRGDTLFVADQACVRLFHRTSGHPLGSACPQGATHLTGLAVAERVVYATDRAATAANGLGIFAIDSRGEISRAPGSETFSHTTGIAAGPWGLFVTCAGEAHVSQLTPTGPHPVLRGGAKHVTGIVAARAASFAFSNWTDSAVHYVDVSPAKGRGGLYTLARDLDRPGQLGYDARRDRILIPEIGRNRITFVELANNVGAWQAADHRR